MELNCSEVFLNNKEKNKVIMIEEEEFKNKFISFFELKEFIENPFFKVKFPLIEYWYNGEELDIKKNELSIYKTIFTNSSFKEKLSKKLGVGEIEEIDSLSKTFPSNQLVGLINCDSCQYLGMTVKVVDKEKFFMIMYLDGEEFKTYIPVAGNVVDVNRNPINVDGETYIFNWVFIDKDIEAAIEFSCGIVEEMQDEQQSYYSSVCGLRSITEEEEKTLDSVSIPTVLYCDDKYLNDIKLTGMKITMEEFKEKVEAVYEDLFDLIKRDLNVEFDFENWTIEPNEFTDNGGDLVGYHITDSGVPYLGVLAGGDWEIPVFFIIYYDGEMKAYIPTAGNIFNNEVMAAFGSEQDGKYTDFKVSMIKWAKENLTLNKDQLDILEKYPDLVIEYFHNEYQFLEYDWEWIKKDINNVF